MVTPIDDFYLVGSYNILHGPFAEKYQEKAGIGADGKCNWVGSRKAKVIENIGNANCSILLLQEVSLNVLNGMKADLEKLKNKFDLVNCVHGAHQSGDGVAILFRQDMFKLVRFGQSPLVDGRVAIFADLEDLKTKEITRVATLHLRGGAPANGVEQAKSVLEFIEKGEGVKSYDQIEYEHMMSDTPVSKGQPTRSIIGGDLNAARGEPRHKVFTDAGYQQDTGSDLLGQKKRITEPSKNREIDHIFVKSFDGSKPKLFTIFDDKQKSDASDHMIALTDVRVPSRARSESDDKVEVASGASDVKSPKEATSPTKTAGEKNSKQVASGSSWSVFKSIFLFVPFLIAWIIGSIYRKIVS